MRIGYFFIFLLFFTSCTSIKNKNWYKSSEMLIYSKKIEVGDIIILKKEHNLDQIFGHSALILNYKTIGEYGKPAKKNKINYEQLPYNLWLYKNKNRKFKIFRLKNINSKIKNRIIKISQKYHSKKYAIFIKKNNSKKVYCSSWIWQIYKKVLEVDLDSDKGIYVFPYDFISSEYLEEINVSKEIKNL